MMRVIWDSVTKTNGHIERAHDPSVSHQAILAPLDVADEIERAPRTDAHHRSIVAPFDRRSKAIADDFDTLPALVELAARLEPQLRRAFIKAVLESRAAIELEAVAEALRDGDISRAEAALHLESVLSESLKRAITDPLRRGFLIGAQQGVSPLLAGGSMSFRFDLVNQMAVDWVDLHAGDLIRETTEQTKLAIRDVIHEAFTEGIDVWDTARTIRSMIGLTDRQIDQLSKFQGKLIDQGVPVEESGERVEKLSGAMLKRRGELIARTEIMRAASEGQQELWRAAIAEGYLDPTHARKVWITTQDDRLCDVCEELDGAEVEVEEEFVAGLSGPPEHPACRCSVGLVFTDEKAIRRPKFFVDSAPRLNGDTLANIAQIDKGYPEFNEDQPRADDGKWSAEGGGGDTSSTESGGGSKPFDYADLDPDDVMREAIEEFGETDPWLAGYLLPGGEWLDFSEGGGIRGLDHRAISQLPSFEGSGSSSGTEDMIAFMRMGAVRWMPLEDRAGANVSLDAEPTERQYEAMVRAARERELPLTFDVDDSSGRTVLSEDVERPTTDILRALFADARRIAWSRAHGENIERSAKSAHEFGFVQARLSHDLAQKLAAWKAIVLDPNDIERDEPDPHVTIRYGLHEGIGLDAIRALLRGVGPIAFTILGFKVFKNPDGHVLTLRVEGAGLDTAHVLLGSLPHTDTHDGYIPHITLAYMKHGRADRYAGRPGDPGFGTIVVDTLEYRAANGVTAEAIPLIASAPESVEKHYGPEEHPSGSPQQEHAGGGGDGERESLRERASKLRLSASRDITPRFDFADQAGQYPKKGKPGISYFKGELDSTQYVNCLLWRDKQGKLRGILNHYPTDIHARWHGMRVTPPIERAGNINVMVDPEWQRKGIATALLEEADKRWHINLAQQQWTREGRLFIQALGRAKKHYGPDEHPGTRSPQQAHAGDDGGGKVDEGKIDWDNLNTGDRLTTAARLLWPDQDIHEATFVLSDGTPVGDDKHSHGDNIRAIEMVANREASVSDILDDFPIVGGGNASETILDFLNQSRAIRIVPQVAGAMLIDPPSDAQLRTLIEMYRGSDLDRITIDIYDPKRSIDNPSDSFELVRPTLTTMRARIQEAFSAKKHYGPEEHPGTGSPQQTHAGDGGRTATAERESGTGGGYIANDYEAPILDGPVDVEKNAEGLRERALVEASKRERRDEEGRAKVRAVIEQQAVEQEEWLKANPLLHFTSPRAVDDALKYGLDTAEELEGKFEEMEDAIDGLKEDLTTLDDADQLHAKIAKYPTRSDFKEKLEALKVDHDWLDLSSPEAIKGEVDRIESEKLALTEAKGSTFAPDKAAGLNKFVFAYHGVAGDAHQFYGSVAIVIDNRAFLEDSGAFATPSDITRYASRSEYSGFEHAVHRGHYNDETIDAYRKDIVNDGGYLKAAAVGRASNVYPGGGWELKIPGGVSASDILGVAVSSLEDYDALIKRGVHESKIKLFDDFGTEGFRRSLEYLQKHKEWPRDDD